MKSIQKLIILVVLLGCGIKAKSQAALFILIFGDKIASEAFHLSLDLGLNASTLPGLDDGDMAFAFTLGMGTHIKLSEQWNLVPEIKFLSPKGVSNIENRLENIDQFDVESVKSSLRLNYIDLPVLLQYRLLNGLYFSAGPQISFLLGAEQKTEVVLISGESADIVQPLENIFEQLNFGVPVEVGYAVKKPLIAGKSMDIRLRYFYGLNNIFTPESGLSANHSAFMLFLTFPFVEESIENN